MKKVLITGLNSYIGNSFEEYISKFDDITVDKISLKTDVWKDVDFSKYDTILHVAGIAHSDGGKISKEKAKLYYDINTKLALEVASSCKGQFIYLSSSIVFGESSKIGKSKIITKDTVPSPINAYGDSKLQAENKLLEMENLKLCIIRPPMVYGKNSKGNYPRLSKLARKTPIFPNVSNKRSMIYIENLCEFIRLVIKNDEQGIFMPQNREYVSTSKLVETIASVHGKKLKLTKLFNIPLSILGLFSGSINKVFGNLVYDTNVSKYKENYQIIDFENSIKRTELWLKTL